MTETVKLSLPIFKPGSTVLHNGRTERVSHVMLRRGQLFVYLQGHTDPLQPEQLSVEPTELIYYRK
jgi:hypothetical protein